jgi:hypothetical protein
LSYYHSSQQHQRQHLQWLVLGETWADDVRLSIEQGREVEAQPMDDEEAQAAGFSLFLHQEHEHGVQHEEDVHLDEHLQVLCPNEKENEIQQNMNELKLYHLCRHHQADETYT